MKHLFNNLSKKEKSRILEQHKGGLQQYINRNTQWGITPWGDDTVKRIKIVDSINKASNNSVKGNIAKTVGDFISILI